MPGKWPNKNFHFNLEAKCITPYLNHLRKVLGLEVLQAYTQLLSNQIDHQYQWNDLSVLYGQQYPYHRVHFEPFKPDKVTIYDRAVRIEKDGLKFMLFSPSNDQKEILNKKNIYLDIIGELGYNDFNGKTSKQVVIDKIEIEERDMKVEDIF